MQWFHLHQLVYYKEYLYWTFWLVTDTVQTVLQLVFNISYVEKFQLFSKLWSDTKQNVPDIIITK